MIESITVLNLNLLTRNRLYPCQTLRASGAIPGMGLTGVNAKDQSVSLQERTFTKSGNSSAENRAAQDIRSSDLPRDFIARKSNSSFDDSQSASSYGNQELRSVLGRRKSIVAADKNSKDRRIVKEGESLSQITIETYGSPRLEYLEWVKEHNPQIVNPDFILPGQNIVLPEYEKVRYRNE